jgi:hypothetical protein
MSDALLVHVAKKPDNLRRNAFPSNNAPAGTEVFENKISLHQVQPDHCQLVFS